MRTETTGTIIAGVLQLDEHINLPENSRVRVAVEPLDPGRANRRTGLEPPERLRQEGTSNSVERRCTTDELHRRPSGTELLDPESPLELRCSALQSMMASDEHKAAEFIVDQLRGEDVSPAWRNQLVLFAEGAQTSDETLRRRLKQRLLEIAASLRQSAEAGVRPVVCSAIRTYASLIWPSEVETLTRFLDPPRPVETRLVTLQSIVHFYEAHPPQDASVPGTLADRIYELADKFLDRDWLIAGEKAAIGQNAAHALAAIGDARVAACVERVLELGMPWVIRQLARKLESTLRIWQVKGIEDSDLPAQRVCEQLRRLAQAPVDNPS